MLVRMWIRRCGLFAWLTALPLCAGTISLSGQSTVTLNAGDALVFTISDYSYTSHAPAFGAPLNPSHVSFTLVTAPLDGAWALTAGLMSLDGSISALFDNLTLTEGSFQGSKYHGPVSTASGSMLLSADVSSQVFTGPAALLTLRNAGGDVILGLSPYTLMQDLKVTFSSGMTNLTGDSLARDSGADVPEPRPLLLTALGAALLFGCWRVRARNAARGRMGSRF